jgi:hypothetical protein
MSFPGRIIKVGETDENLVRQIATALAGRGYVPRKPLTPGKFDSNLKSLIKLYQTQNVDIFGRRLEDDGEIGRMTWGSLFGADAVNIPPTGFAGLALGIAISQLGVLEQPLGSNRGKMVDDYQQAVGLTLIDGKPGFFWCMAFVYWCFLKAGNGTTPFPKTAGCLDAWNRVYKKAPGRLVTRAAAIADPLLVKPGMVFILDHGGGAGHTGFVRQSSGGALKTVEGNTNVNGSNNGLGVFELNSRNVMNKSLKGFIDFT